MLRFLCIAALLSAAAIPQQPASACPFCTALRPTLSQRRETATVVALAETVAEGKLATFELHRVERGEALLHGKSSLTIDVEGTFQIGGLALLFADADPDQPVEQWEWSAEPANELVAGYFFAAPPLTVEGPQRLRYFARYLEHAEPLVAEDAWQEFGHAPFDQVAQVADGFSSEKLRRWLADPRVPGERKGFYGLALGLVTEERRANLVFLRQLVRAPADDFRAGFDGVLGGFLVAGGTEALDEVQSRFLEDPHAADGDLRHVVSALRFYQEYGKQIPQERLNVAMRALLDRPEFAAAAIVDLARWRDWQPVARIADLYTGDPRPSAATRRAIVGYLLACPRPAAAEHLAELRRQDPQGVQQATASLALPLGRGNAQ